MMSPEGFVSSNPNMARRNEKLRKHALTIFGKAYGYSFIQRTPSLPPSQLPGPKVPGWASIGLASSPPNIGPMIIPIFMHIGIIKNALD